MCGNNLTLYCNNCNNSHFIQTAVIIISCSQTAAEELEETTLSALLLYITQEFMYAKQREKNLPIRQPTATNNHYGSPVSIFYYFFLRMHKFKTFLNCSCNFLLRCFSSSLSDHQSQQNSTLHIGLYLAEL